MAEQLHQVSAMLFASGLGVHMVSVAYWLG